MGFKSTASSVEDWCDICNRSVYYSRTFHINSLWKGLIGRVDLCWTCSLWMPGDTGHVIERAKEYFNMSEWVKSLNAKEQRALAELTKLTSIFSDDIAGFFIMPKEAVPYDDKVRRPNVVVRLKAMSATVFVSESEKDGMNLMEYWNKGERDKFWTLRLTKLILVLMRLHYAGPLNIWIQGYTKIFEVSLFYTKSLVQVHPEYLVTIDANKMSKEYGTDKRVAQPVIPEAEELWNRVGAESPAYT